MKLVQIEDCRNIGKLSFLDWENVRDTSFLITGSTGLIGSNLVNALAYNSLEKNLNIKIFLPVRNIESAQRQFSWTKAQIIPYQIGQSLEISSKVDYIIHLASPTSSQYFINHPVDTLEQNIEGTRALLEWAKDNLRKKFIYLSTMEVYGFPSKGHKVQENELGSFETMNARNSYPIAKLACEAICYSYYSQFKVPAVILRATQTFGPGVHYDDGRVFAQFMRSAIEKKDIILKSKGLTERSYLYTSDAVSAIILCAIQGKPGEAYSLANPDTYIAINDMAKMVAKDIAGGEIKVRYDIAENIEKLGYASTLFMDLDISKLRKLGWEPTVGLIEAYRRLIRYFVDGEE